MSTQTRSFGAGKREGHDSTPFYERRLKVVAETRDSLVRDCPVKDCMFLQSAESMSQLPDASVALMVTSPPYHVGKDYDAATSFEEYLDLLERVFRETYRVLEPGGRAVVNVANLGRRPYIPLTHLVTQRMLRIGYYMRGEIIWQKGKGASGNCAWGSWQSARNPVIRDIHEYLLCFSKGRFDRAREGTSTIERDDFLQNTLSIWTMSTERARKVGHPAPFPVELPRRFIELYTFQGDLVLDPFMGCGSTAVAATMAKRHWVGYEIEPQYVVATEARVAAARAALGTNGNGKHP